jgi:hypothetical protein
MKRLLVLCALLAACKSSTAGLDTDGPFPLAPSDLAGVDAPSSVSAPDLAAAVDAQMSSSCPCAKGSYCDLATSTCKPGCAFDADCAPARCDTASHQCVNCGNLLCGAGQQCCFNGATPTCAASCGGSDMGSITVSCQGPADCRAGTPLCCAHVTLGSFPACGYTAVVQCEASCTFMFPVCGQSGQAEVCKKKSDCGDAMAPNCCTYTFQGQTASFCVSNGSTGLATSCL